jgi:hypothetical protein
LPILLIRKLYMHILLEKSYIVYMSPRRSYVAHFAQFAESLTGSSPVMCTLSLRNILQGASRVRVHSSALFISEWGVSIVRIQPNTLFFVSGSKNHTHVTFVIQYIYNYSIQSILSRNADVLC